MSHQDKKVECRFQADDLKAVLRWLFADLSWVAISFRGDCSWTPALLAAAALLWSWLDESTLVERFQSARSIIMFLFPGQQELAGSYQAFMKMLRRWTAPLVGLLQTSLQGRLGSALPEHWAVDGLVAFGVDGSRIDLPRTESNEQAYAASRHGQNAKKRGGKSRRRKDSRKADSPQMWLTTMLHLGTGLPWDWRTGPADSSERAHMLEMLPGLPLGAMVLADAGFVGYEYARAIVDGGRSLLIRVGANVRLIRKLGVARESAGTVYLWPNDQARRNQTPLVLRLILANKNGRPVHLLTSVLDARQLSDRQAVELYRQRWGIELFYRHLKQTFERRKLRSTSPQNAEIEMQWSYLALGMMGLYALVEAAKKGVSPHRLSVAQMLRAFRRTLRDYRHPLVRGKRLCHRLRAAVTDSYVRQNKTSRNYPRKKQGSPPGPPTITIASHAQVQRARLLDSQAKERLTA